MAAPQVMVTGSRVAAEAAAPEVPGEPIEASYRYFPPIIVPTEQDRERYDGEDVSPVKLVAAEPVSTFSVDVDTAAYANARRFIKDGQMPPAAAVRTEEFINYFRYDYDAPREPAQPFAVDMDVASSPWNTNSRLVRIGLSGYKMPAQDRPPANLVFLLDVSGSMNSRDKLPLVKTALRSLVTQLTPQDRVSIVVYAGAAGLVLEPTSDATAIRNALDQLAAGGSTAGGAGLELAYRIAEDNRIAGGVNRVILATDGDFNVGQTDQDALVDMIERKREAGTTLTVLGFGRGNVNDAMMEQIADHGNGNYAYIDSALEARKVLGEQMGATIFTIAKDVKIQVEFNPMVVSQYRLIGYENRTLREQDFDDDSVDAGDIGAGHQVTALYEVIPAGTEGWIAQRRYETPADSRARDLAAEAAHVKLRYKLPDGDTSTLIEHVLPASALARPAPPRGDFAFGAAVAGFGQKLRGDTLLGEFSYADIATLAGPQQDFWRQEFIQLVKAAQDRSASE
ncbi:VWA domain-containing protein [Erythrobacter sp. QSSC1-22B]|uniref:vWA domain-containing protein n=1 Tax=Erythrobacter sp. QSSC1-22B TaxID=1860125 RepID=UPI000AD6538F|nr:VWA domain-containing protein [Erythrobacter sp. QSSC1-22B]